MRNLLEQLIQKRPVYQIVLCVAMLQNCCLESPGISVQIKLESVTGWTGISVPSY